MHFHIVTLFPKGFNSYLGESILKRGIEDGKIKVSFYNPRDFVENKWKRVDRPPYGGGPGLVIEALPVVKAIESVLKLIAKSYKLKATKIIFLSPRGKQFTNDYAKKTAKKYKNIILVCGRYEGIEERRISSSEVYTRPEVFKHRGKLYRVPKILLSGHRAKIDEWKKKRRC